MALITRKKDLSKYVKQHPVLSRMSPCEMKVFGLKANELLQKGCLDTDILETLGIYSSLVVQLQEVNESIQASGLTETFVDRYGHERTGANPLFKVKRDLLSDIRRTGRLFEFSPRDAKEIYPDRNQEKYTEGLLSKLPPFPND